MSCFQSKGKVVLSLYIGKLEGLLRETTNKKVEFISFTKIPYGVPPVGDKRFLRPERFGSWEGTRNATIPCPKPVQFIPNYGGLSSVVGEEDCLYLNIYTPDLPVTENQKKFPVIIWIHGGNYLWGDASERFYFPKNLIESGSVVVVTFNYRLGPLGFLTLGNELVPGNMGLWDQRLAMEWVRTHIGNFGGDTNKITLMGHDAGSVCVSNHIASKGSSGLFQRAICMSGTLLADKFCFDVSSDAEALNTFKEKFLKACGINDPEKLSDDDLLTKLQDLSLKKLIDASNNVREELSSSPLLINPWAPVLDKDFSKKAFFPESPLESIRQGNFNKMPLLMGTSRHSGIALLKETVHSSDNRDRLKRDWTVLGGELILNRPESILRPQEDLQFVNAIKEYYFDSEEFTEEAGFDRLIDAVGDSVFVGANAYFMKLIQEGSAQPIYLYNFDHLYTNLSGGDAFSLSTSQFIMKLLVSKVGVKILNEKKLGISHWEELLCLFSGRESVLFRNPLRNSLDTRVASIFSSFVINFASTGNPTSSSGVDEVLGDLEWECVVSDKKIRYLSISSSPEMRDYDGGSFKFLQSLFKKRYS